MVRIITNVITGTVLPDEMSVVLITIAKTIAAYKQRVMRKDCMQWKEIPSRDYSYLFPNKNCVQFPLSRGKCRRVVSKARRIFNMIRFA